MSVDFSYEDVLDDFSKARLPGLNFAVGALPSILADNKDDIVDTEEWMKARNEEDEKVKNQQLKEIMDQVNATYNKSDTMGSRIKDLVDEWSEAGDSLDGL